MTRIQHFSRNCKQLTRLFQFQSCYYKRLGFFHNIPATFTKEFAHLLIRRMTKLRMQRELSYREVLAGVSTTTFFACLATEHDRG